MKLQESTTGSLQGTTVGYLLPEWAGGGEGPISRHLLCQETPPIPTVQQTKPSSETLICRGNVIRELDDSIQDRFKNS